MLTAPSPGSLAVAGAAPDAGTVCDVMDQWLSGNLDARLDPKAIGTELGLLFTELNQLAATMARRVQGLSSQESELSAMLTSLGEGILVVDSELCLVRVNDAALQLLTLSRDRALGKSVQEVVRHTRCNSSCRARFQATKPSTQEVTIWNGDERILELRGSALLDPDGRAKGALLVLNDVTRVRRLQKVRSDFVANVSHELKTPITSKSLPRPRRFSMARLRMRIRRGVFGDSGATSGTSWRNCRGPVEPF